MTKKEIMEEWGKESRAANQVICEILDAYTKFCLFCVNGAGKSDPVEALTRIRTVARNMWDNYYPLLEQSRKMLNDDPEK